jgi:aspartyl-tRNA(Asn)/glutamyl-tRNA(Gln) amidotransferase subunit B
MEKGQLRCDVNINIAFESDSGEIRTPITEVKNVNSTRAVERAITAEAERQYAEWQTGGPIRERKGKLTAGWDEDTEQVTVQRAKEGSADYRYMPEPDLPPLVIATVPHLQSEQLVLPVLPNELRRTFLEKGVALADGELLLAEPVLRSALSTWEGAGVATREAAKWLIQVPGSAQLQGEQAAELVKLCADGQLSLSAIKPHVPELAESGESVTTFAEQRSLLQQHDSAVVELAVAAVLEEQAAAVADYRAGNTRILGFLVGQVMKRSAGKAQPAKVQEAVEAALQSSH